MPSGAVNPLDNPEAWDSVQISGQPSPGLCKLSGFRRNFEWDVKKGKGTIGGTVTFVGRPPAKGSITFKLWTPAHFAQWDLFRPLLKYDPTKKAVQAVDLYHPSLADVDMNSFVTENVGAIEHDGNGLYTIAVDFLEYFPPPKASAVSTPSGSTNTTTKSGAGKPNPQPVLDAQEEEIRTLLKTAAQP